MKIVLRKGWIVSVCLLAASLSWAEKGPGTYYNLKDGNAVTKAEPNSKAVAKRTVAFLGGSITEMNGFRPRVMKMLRALIQCDTPAANP